MSVNCANDSLALAKARQCLEVPHEYGHSDLGEWLCHYLQGHSSLELFLWKCDVTWLDSEAPPPER